MLRFNTEELGSEVFVLLHLHAHTFEPVRWLADAPGSNMHALLGHGTERQAEAEAGAATISRTIVA